jgi:hypothetical protein
MTTKPEPDMTTKPEPEVRLSSDDMRALWEYAEGTTAFALDAAVAKRIYLWVRDSSGVE